jgi:transketolase
MTQSVFTTRELANALRFLSIDAIQKANSGHPGMPLGMADIATVLWRNFLRHDPATPHWHNRDRFILSNGHGSMLHYALLHLSGYNVTLDDIKQFRQLHSKTPGHPEVGCTDGIEVTTGPLGQGLANAVGMALAEKISAAHFNRPQFQIVDHRTYVFAGDGCLMEGISHEACSLAGTHQLGKLIVFWDDNQISIDGNTEGWFTENVLQRFAAYGWHVIPRVDGHDPVAITQAIEVAHAETSKPTLIDCKTVIGFGAPHLCGKHDCHGAPLGEAEVVATRVNLQWRYPPFVIPNEMYAMWDARNKGAALLANCQQAFAAYQKKYPELAAEFLRRKDGGLPQDWISKSDAYIATVNTQSESLATRKASQNCIEAYAPMLPELFGGSADLTGSNLTNWSGTKSVTRANSEGNYLHYGVREFGMFAIMNGMALHGGFIPYGGTFLIFSDYGRNAIRMAALMRQRVIFVLTHDSIGLGEDGPTHQPIEQLASLRLIPGLSVWRPSDAVETAAAWQFALERRGPTCLVLSRQKLAGYKHADVAVIKRGGYVLWESEVATRATVPDGIIMATGSEVALAVKAAQQMKEQHGKNIRVVALPSLDVFEQQDIAYRESVLPPTVKVRIAIEAGVTSGWYKYVGSRGRILGIDRFGESAPEGALYKLMGLTVEHLLRELLGLFAEAV